MKELAYQEEAIEDLVKKIDKLLHLPGSRKKLVFKAPTGSGKTVMACEALRRLNAKLANEDETPNKVAYIWIAPNKLHQQSYFKFNSYFAETRELHPIFFNEVDQSVTGGIKSGEILFVNWESINKDKALMARDTETASSLFDITRRTQEEHDTPIVLVIDEEHLFASNLKNKSEDVLKGIEPKVEIRISATPTTIECDAHVDVDRSEVIREQMIKKGIELNPALQLEKKGISLNSQLTEIALAKRNELAKAYKKIGVHINPLLLIQLPNDKTETLDEEAKNIRDEVVDYLESQKKIITSNGKLAIWLSNEKENLEDIEKPNSKTEVLLFKQAIALGWDCPRAAVLLIFREMKSVVFTAQTVGRILRMPEQKHYVDDTLNFGYVYTNVSEEIIEVVKDDISYFSCISAKRRANLHNVLLPSEYMERPASSRTRLGGDFKAHLSMTLEKEWSVKNCDPLIISPEQIYDEEYLRGNKVECENQQVRNRKAVKDFLKINVGNINENVVKDVELTGEVGKKLASSMARHILNSEEIAKIYYNFCKLLIGTQYYSECILTLSTALEEVLDGLFGLYSNDAKKMVVYKENYPKFEDVTRKALETYLPIVEKRKQNTAQKSIIEYSWEIPVERIYNEESHEVRTDVKNHALVPFVELKVVSNPEKRFTAFLEKNSQWIDWWYKNGDSGKEHFSISYTNSKGVKALFYVDFIIRLKNGQVFLFDTKSKDSDKEATLKHNALIDYMKDHADLNLMGGIIIEEGSNWKFCIGKIEDTDPKDWNCFYPDTYK